MIAKLGRSGMTRTIVDGSRLPMWYALSMMSLTIQKPVTIGVSLSESHYQFQQDPPGITKRPRPTDHQRPIRVQFPDHDGGLQ